MKFTGGWINVSHWIEFKGFWKVLLVELNAWYCCPEHVIAIEWITIDSDGFSNSMHDASICNNWRISKWLEYESHHQWTVSKWFWFIIFFWTSSLTETFHDEKFHQKCNATRANSAVQMKKLLVSWYADEKKDDATVKRHKLIEFNVHGMKFFMCQIQKRL